VISVITNVMPREMTGMVSAALAGNYDRAREMHFQMLALMRALFIETNPIPIKHAMSLLKICSPEVRMPLTPMSAPAAEKLRAVMKEMRLLQP
jgi:4-hydroxy-tetrahydrodipicolinate synthase